MRSMSTFLSGISFDMTTSLERQGKGEERESLHEARVKHLHFERRSLT